MNAIDRARDSLLKRILAYKLAQALLDENGLPPTQNAMEVIIAVVRSTIRTDEKWKGMGIPTITGYAMSAESALHTLWKNRNEAMLDNR